MDEQGLPNVDEQGLPNKDGPVSDWPVGWVLVVLVVLVAGCGGTGDQGPATPAATPAPATTAAAVAKPCLEEAEQDRVVRFTSDAGASLVGVVLGSGRAGLVVGHQVGSDLCEWLPQAREFAGRGYRVLALDFAGFGDSQPGSGADAGADSDVVAAAEELRRRGAEEIVLIGSSMGGTAVLSAATRIRPPVAGVVSLSGPASFQGVDAGAAVPRLRVPVLLAAGGDDQPFADDARAMYRAAPVRDKRLLVVPGGGHGTSLLEFGEDAPRVLAAVRKFVADHTRR
jgi:pimeloyl-ACP methyl ester carboxylesterase